LINADVLPITYGIHENVDSMENMANISETQVTPKIHKFYLQFIQLEEDFY